MLEPVHHTFFGVVVQQQGDRTRHVDLGDIGVELNLIAREVDQETPDRLSQTRAPERRSVQVSDQGANAIRGSVLRLLDLEQKLLGLIDLAGPEMPPRHIDLDREAEQELREIVVQELGDLHALVLAFLRHAVRQGSEHLFAVLELLVRFLQSFAAEEHLPRKEE
ncbi:MAG TPA: hypothetical protein VFM81_10635, partial [Actinomycetota bacterium]|nr:hypothetical protein [Actinomycetota bacterium]